MSRFSQILMDHFESPRNMGTMDNPDLVGLGSLGGQAPFVTLKLRICEGIVKEARFQASGCGVTIAAASVLTELIVGQRLAECTRISDESVLDALGGLPADKRYCASVAVMSLRDALSAIG